MKRFLTILALLAFAATAQAKSYSWKDYTSNHGSSFTSLEQLIQDISFDFNKKQKKHKDQDFDWSRILKDFDKKFDHKELKKVWEKYSEITTCPPTNRVPDGGTTIAMLGVGLLALAGLKRTLRN